MAEHTVNKPDSLCGWEHGFCMGLLTLCGALGEFVHISKPQLPRHGADNHSTWVKWANNHRDYHKVSSQKVLITMMIQDWGEECEMFCSCSKSWFKMSYPGKDLMCSTLSQSHFHTNMSLLCQSITSLFFFLKTLLLRVNLASGIISSP